MTLSARFIFALFFLIPAQMQVVSNGRTATLDNLQSDALGDIFRMSHQLLYYQADLKHLKDEMNDLVLKQYLEAIIRIQDSSRNVIGASTNRIIKDALPNPLATLSNFRETGDAILKCSLADAAKNELFIVITNEVFPIILEKKESFLEDLNAGIARYIDYLPSRFVDEYNADVATLRSEKQGLKKIGGTYNRLIWILKKLAPAYEELLEQELTPELIAEAYIRCKAEEAQAELLNSFLVKYGDRDFIPVISPKITESFQKDLKNLLKNMEAPAALFAAGKVSEEVLETYLRRADTDYFEKRREVMATIKEVTVDALKLVAVSEVRNAEDYVKQNPIVKKYDSAFNSEMNRFRPEHSAFPDYLDIGKTKGRKYWLRLRFAAGTAKTVEATKMLNDQVATLNIVYQPATTTTGAFIGKALLKKDSIDEKKVMKALRELHVEVPVGITIHHLNLSTENVDTKYFAQLHVGNNEFKKVNVGYGVTGIWTNLKYNAVEMSKFAEAFQLPAGLGINIQRIEVDPSTWDPKFHFSWRPQGFVAEMLARHDAGNFSVSFSEIPSSTKGLKDDINSWIRKKIADELNATLRNNTKDLKEILSAEDVQPGEVRFDNEALVGSIKIRPEGISKWLPSFGAGKYLELSYRFTTSNGRPVFELTQPRFDARAVIEQQVRDWLDKLLDGVAGLDHVANRRNALTNLLEQIGISDVLIDFKSRTACSVLNFTYLETEATVCLDLNTGKILTSALDKIIRTKVREYVRTRLMSVIKDQFEDLVANLAEPLMLFGLPFEKSADNPRAWKLKDGDLSVTVNVSSSGLKLENFAPTEEFKDRLKNVVSSATGDLKEFVRLQDPRFVGGNFVVDLLIDVSSAPGLSFMPSGPTKVGSISIDLLGHLRMDGTPLGDIGAIVTQSIYSELDKKINQHLKSALPEKFDFSNIATIRPLRVASNLAKKTIDIVGEVSFEELSIRVDDIRLRITVPNLSVELITPTNLKSILINGIAQNFLKDALASSCSAMVGICDVEVDAPNLTISGVIKVSIPDVLTLPGMDFTLSPKKFKTTLAPQIPLYGSYPIAPGVVMLDPTLRFDLMERRIRGYTTITIGASEEARITSLIVNVGATLDISLSNIGRVSYEGTLRLVTLIPIQYGTGYIDLQEASFGMKEGTSNLVSKVLNCKRVVNVYGNERRFESLASINILGIAGMSVDMHGKVQPGFLDFKAAGQMSIPLLTMKGDFSTRFVPFFPISHVIYGNANMNGRLNIAGFEIAGLDTRVNINRVSAAFNALGAELSLVVPVAEALTEGKILDMILAMFAFDLADFAKFFESLMKPGSLKLEFHIGDFESGDSPDSHYENGVGGRDGAITASDDVGDDQHASGSHTTLISAINRSMARVNDTKSKTIRVANGYRCKGGFDFWGFCAFGNRVPKWKERVIQEETFNYTVWPGIWKCLPANYQNYYAVFGINERDDKSRHRVYGLVGPKTGDRITNEQKIPFLLQTPLKVHSRKVNGAQSLCLSRSNDQYCFPVSDVPNEVLTTLTFSGNIAYTDNDVAIFISASLPTPSESPCTKNSTSQVVASDMYREINAPGTPYSNLRCNDCFDLQNQVQMKETKLAGKLVFYRKTAVEGQNSIEKGFRSVLSTQPDILTHFDRWTEDTTATDATNRKAIRELTKNIPVGGHVCFTDENVFGIHPEQSTVNADVAVFVNNTLKKMEAFYQFLDGIWLSVPAESFLGIFDGRMAFRDPSERRITRAFAQLQEDTIKNYKSLEVMLHQYVQTWLYYGLPEKVVVDTREGSLLYSFDIWNYSASGSKNYAYTFVNSTPDHKLLAKDRDGRPKNSFSISLSDLTDGIGLTNILSDHKGKIESGCKNNVYRNSLFFLTSDTVINRKLLSVSPTLVVYGNHNVDDPSGLRLSYVKAGCDFQTEQRANAQLFPLDFIIGGDKFNQDADLKSHNLFYDSILRQLKNDPGATAYIQKFPYQYGNRFRAVVFSGKRAQFFWESPDNKIAHQMLNAKFLDVWASLSRGDKENFNGRRIFVDVSQGEASARALLSGLDGIDAWLDNGAVNPLSGLNKNL